eukprot:GHVP01064052.1.p1 GENE.GHVP01064052.1~~GHVP01064052.1.p1  ORF type:complete len:145 (+),score=22.97 GHVP01064052.1:412-846(+)
MLAFFKEDADINDPSAEFKYIQIANFQDDDNSDEQEIVKSDLMSMKEGHALLFYDEFMTIGTSDVLRATEKEEKRTIDGQEVLFILYKSEPCDYSVVNVVVNGQSWFNIDQFSSVYLVEDADPQIDERYLGVGRSKSFTIIWHF